MRKLDGGRWTRVVSVLCVLTLAGAAFVLPTGLAGAAQPSGTPIKIGYMAETQGAAAIDQVPVMAAWTKWTNAHGGVDGHPVQFIADTEPSNVAVAVTDAQKLIADGVTALIDGDGNDTAWASMAETAGVPVFSSTDSLAFGSSDDSFGVPQSPVVSPDELMAAAKKVGATKVALLYCTEYPQCAQAVPFYESVAKKFGVDLVYNAAVSGSAPNYLAQCLAAKAAGATGLFVASTSVTALRVVGSCAKQGYTPHLLAGSGSYEKGFLGQPGTNGLVAVDGNVPFFDTSSPAIESMTKDLNQTNPSITKSASYDDTAVWNWAIGVILGEALKAGNLGATTTVTPAALRDALFTLHTTNAGGLSTPLTFTRGQPEINDCYYVVGIKNNKFTLPYGLKDSCAQTS